MKKLNIRSLLILFLLLAGIGITAFIVSQRGTGQFELRQRASGPSGIATLEMVTEATDRYVGDVFPVKIMLSTGGVPVSVAAFRLWYPSSSVPPELEVVDSDPNVPGVQIESHAGDLGLSTNVNDVVREADGRIRIDFSATTTSITGYSTTDKVLFAVIKFKANKVKRVEITHDSFYSKITRKSDGLDILQTIPTFVLTLLADTQAPTVTITGGIENNAAMRSGSVTFTWSGVDSPTRPSDAVSQLVYSYQFNSYQFNAETWSTYVAGTTVTRTLRHGRNIFRVRGKDISGNISTPASPTSERAFTVDLTPTITDISLTHATAGTSMTITGTNFGTTKQTVRFGTVVTPALNITSWTNTQIVLKVPANGDGDISVSVPVTPSTGAAITLVSNKMAFQLDTTLRLFFGYQGISGDKGPRKVTVVVKRGTYASKKENLDATYDTVEGAYKVETPPLDRPMATGVNYTVSIVDNAHLRRQFKNVSMTFGNANVLKKKAAGDNLIIADFNEDNNLTLDDFSLLMAKITALSVTVIGADMARFDLNADGVLDVTDAVLLLSNYTALSKLGDPE